MILPHSHSDSDGCRLRISTRRSRAVSRKTTTGLMSSIANCCLIICLHREDNLLFLEIIFRKKHNYFFVFFSEDNRWYNNKAKNVLFLAVAVIHWCEWRDLNPYVMQHTPLKRACLPIPAHSHLYFFHALLRTLPIITDSNWFVKPFFEK